MFNVPWFLQVWDSEMGRIHSEQGLALKKFCSSLKRDQEIHTKGCTYWKPVPEGQNPGVPVGFLQARCAGKKPAAVL